MSWTTAYYVKAHCSVVLGANVDALVIVAEEHSLDRIGVAEELADAC